MCLKKFMVGNPQLTVDVEVEEDFDESEVEMEEDFEADGKNDSKDDKLCDLYVKYCTASQCNNVTALQNLYISPF